MAVRVRRGLDCVELAAEGGKVNGKGAIGGWTVGDSCGEEVIVCLWAIVGGFVRGVVGVSGDGVGGVTNSGGMRSRRLCV